MTIVTTAASNTNTTALYNSGAGWKYVPNCYTARSDGSALGTGYADLFTGVVRRATPQLGDDQQTCTLECVDALARLDKMRVTSGLHQSKTTGELVRRVLADGADWRADFEAVDTGQDTVPYAWWTAEPMTDALRGIERSEWGQVFIDGRGYAVFHDRVYRSTAATGAGMALDDTAVTAIDVVRDDADVINDVRVNSHPRTVPRTAVPIWNLRQTIALAAGGEQTVFADYTDPLTQKAVPALNPISPVAYVDYAANTSATGGVVTAISTPSTAGTGYDAANPPAVYLTGGGGYGAQAVATVDVTTGGVSTITITNGGGGYTSAPTVTIAISPSGGTNASGATATVSAGTDKTTSLSVSPWYKNFGQTAIIKLKNTDAGAVYVTYMRLRGDPLMEPDTTPSKASDGASIARYLPRAVEIDQPWQQSSVNSDTVATTLLARYKNPTSRLRLTVLANQSTYSLQSALAMELDEMLTVSLARAYIASANYFIGEVEHVISERGLVHMVRLSLERSRYDGGAVFDTGVFDTAKFS